MYISHDRATIQSPWKSAWSAPETSSTLRRSKPALWSRETKRELKSIGRIKRGEKLLANASEDYFRVKILINW